MRSWNTNLPAVVLAVLLVGCVIAVYLTADASSVVKPSEENSSSIVDEGLAKSARKFLSIADSNEEQALAREAVRLAELETDQDFASALRDSDAVALPATGPLRQLAESIASLKSQIATSQAGMAKLAKAAEADEASADQFELAKAQLALNQDELADAQQDLARQGGDPGAAIERAFQEYQSARRLAPPPTAAPAPTATMNQQFRAWFMLRDRARKLEAARQQAVNVASALEQRHKALEEHLASLPQSHGRLNPEEPEAKVARLHELSERTKRLTEFDKRIAVTRQLDAIYARWIAHVTVRRSGIAHLLLSSLAIILAILLALEMVSQVIRGIIGRQTDRRRLHQLRALNTIALQAAGAILILFVVFGIPTQTSTMIGLATAGLTVALKDFIVAFFGWFALMGRNGIRVGDWVEIEGVGGEVIEIGVLKTVLLEMGNWTNTGHPTGRRVAFMNKFAIENHYFNFSTAGQWLWDELRLTLPTSGDPYAMAMQIRDIVDRETAGDADQAQQDWERVTTQYGTRPFSAKPAVDLKPSVNGLEVIVRYITRAPQRNEVKSRLFEAIVAIIHKSASAANLSAP